jgi:hypothetical protein
MTLNSTRRSIRVAVGALLLVAQPLIAFASGGGGTSVSTATDTGAASPVPEPGAMLLFAAGALVVGAAIRRKRS